MPADSDEAAKDPQRRTGRPAGIAALFYSSVIDGPEESLPQPKLPLRIGAVLNDGEGRYELVDAIAHGRQAAVFRAIDRRWADTRLYVAVKLFPPALGGRDQALVEGRLARLAHDPNVVTVLDAGTTTEGWPFLVLQMLDAIDLRTWRKSRSERVDARRVAQIGRDVARGLVAVHAAQLVHCDVSPQNILVDQRSRAILADFGCAKQASAESDDSAPTGGTPAFMPAEQWRGADPDDRSDVAALGGVLYWLLTDEPPYGERVEFIRAAHAAPDEADARRRRALGAAGVDQELAALIRSMLDADPAARPTASTIEKQLDAWLSRSQRVRKGWVLIAALILVIASGTATYVLLRPAPIAVVLGTATEFGAVEDVLGVSPSDEHFKLLVSRCRSAADVEWPRERELKTLAWLDSKYSSIARADPVPRWLTATLSASLALELRDLKALDRWLALAEPALNDPAFDSLRGDQRWFMRFQGLVAGARLLRLEQVDASLASSDGAPLSTAEIECLSDWLQIGSAAWRVPDATPTSLLLDRLRLQALTDPQPDAGLD